MKLYAASVSTLPILPTIKIRLYNIDNPYRITLSIKLYAFLTIKNGTIR